MIYLFNSDKWIYFMNDNCTIRLKYFISVVHVPWDVVCLLSNWLGGGGGGDVKMLLCESELELMVYPKDKLDCLFFDLSKYSFLLLEALDLSSIPDFCCIFLNCSKKLPSFENVFLVSLLKFLVAGVLQDIR